VNGCRVGTFVPNASQHAYCLFRLPSEEGVDEIEYVVARAVGDGFSNQLGSHQILIPCVEFELFDVLRSGE
jgi:hypothetical protein